MCSSGDKRFWFHVWGKWVLLEGVATNLITGHKRSVTGQQRECLRCGKVQQRIINP